MTSASTGPSWPAPTPPRVSRRIVAGTALTGLTAIAAGPLAHPSPRSAMARQATPVAGTDDAFQAEVQLALTNIVESSLAQSATPGALVGIWYPGQGTWTYAAGVRDLTTANPMATADTFRIASITKTFTATVILQLVDEGRIGLDDVLEPHIPGIANGDRITVRQVLGMTAGIFDYVNDPIIAANYDLDPLMAFTPRQGLDVIRQHPADFAPGDHVQYSNSNYLLLGLIIEQVTGQTADVAITERIIRPLGLDQTVFPTTPDLPEPFVRGYESPAVGATLRDVTSSNPAVPWTAGAMYSTLADLRVWAKALADGTLLDPATQRDRLAWNVFPGQKLDVRYGLGVLEVNGLIGHSGGIFGYSSWMVHASEENATIVIATNRADNEGGSADPIFIQIIRLLFPERFPASAATPATASPIV